MGSRREKGGLDYKKLVAGMHSRRRGVARNLNGNLGYVNGAGFARGEREVVTGKHEGERRKGRTW
jgi:hypothetical protein